MAYDAGKDVTDTADDHMSDFEALMWNLEKDPRLSANMANLSMLDRAPDMAILRQNLERATVVLPRLRQRVAPVFGRLAPPRWVPDEHFSIDHHLKRVPLGGRATRRELYDLVTSLFLDPFDRTRPLWEFVVIDGLADGKAAMLQRMHHSITDGEGGLRLSLEFVDFERDAPPREPLDPPEWAPVDASLMGSLGDAVVHLTRRQLGVARRAAATTFDHTIHPTRIVETTNTAAFKATSVARQARVTDRPLSTLWTERSLRRRFDTIDVDFDEARAAATALGGTLNDLFVTGAVVAAGNYHRQVGATCEELRIAMPVSTRSRDQTAGNQFSPTQLVVPTGPASVAERFGEIHELLASVKGDATVGVADSLAGVINLLPTSVVTRTGFRLASTIDFVTSNIRAAPMDVFIAGALMEANYPLGPIAGTAFNITTMSYRGVFNMGVVIDTVAVDDPELLVSSLRTAYQQLLAAA